MSELAGFGEDRLVSELLAQLPATGRAGGVLAGAGDDDCAVLRPPGGRRWQLLKTDCVIEGVHFTSSTEPTRIGWKALCRPLSDIAASGGTPAFALVTFGISKNADVEWARGVYAGLGRAARMFKVQIVGGDTAATPGPCFISVCLTGSVERRHVVLRSGGRVGDALFVTGRLGGSFASGRHLDFRPRVTEAQWLVSRFRPRAMMDLSDGLATDLPRLARASGIGFEIDPARLPRAKGCTTEQAIADGEDYELLFALPSREAARLTVAWKRKFPRLALTCIGKLSVMGSAKGLSSAGGYDHFHRR